MLFSEPLFLFFYLPSILFIYTLSYRSGVTRLFLLMSVSFLFYFWGEPKFVPVVILSSLADFLIARRMVFASSGRNIWLILGILNNVGILIYYKYLNFIS